MTAFCKSNRLEINVYSLFIAIQLPYFHTRIIRLQTYPALPPIDCRLISLALPLVQTSPISSIGDVCMQAITDSARSFFFQIMLKIVLVFANFSKLSVFA